MSVDSATFQSKLQKAFEEGLHVPSNTEFSKLEYAKSPQWDSLAHLELINAIEMSFNIMIDTQDVLAMSSYSKAVEIVKKYVSTTV